MSLFFNLLFRFWASSSILILLFSKSSTLLLNSPNSLFTTPAHVAPSLCGDIPTIFLVALNLTNIDRYYLGLVSENSSSDNYSEKNPHGSNHNHTLHKHKHQNKSPITRDLRHIHNHYKNLIYVHIAHNYYMLSLLNFKYNTYINEIEK